MKTAWLAILLITVFSGGISVITRINEYTQVAANAYARQDYIEAIASYEYLLDDLEVKDDQIQLNLAHAYYQAGLYPQAMSVYQLLADHPSQHLRALAHLQLGNIHTKQKRLKRALSLYKLALIAEPGNDAARYNYELLKKYLELHPEADSEEEKEAPASPEQTPQPDSLQAPPPNQEELQPQPKKKPDEQGDQQEELELPSPDANGQQQQPSGQQKQDTPQGPKEREEKTGNAPGDTEGSNPDNLPELNQPQGNLSTDAVSEEEQRAQTRRARLRQANMSPEKAKLLLDAMRNAELQYIQQLPKKATRKAAPGKPDW